MAGAMSIDAGAPVDGPAQDEFERDASRQLGAIEGKTVAESQRSMGAQSGRRSRGGECRFARFVGEKAKGRSANSTVRRRDKIVPIDAVRPAGRSRPRSRASSMRSWHSRRGRTRICLADLNRILFVPIRACEGSSPSRRPSSAEPSSGRRPKQTWSGSRRNGSGTARLISAGWRAELPKASQTDFIHVRPKARDARDRDMAPGGFDVTRKCFWLNSGYVETIIREHGGPSR